MNRKSILLAMLLLLSVSLCACGKKSDEAATTAVSENVVKNEIVSFVNDSLPSIRDNRDQAVAIYNSYFNKADLDVEAFKNDLTNNAIPKMEEYINSLNAIEVTSDEVSNLKSMYLQAAQKQYDALKMVKSALDGENAEYLTQAENLINESKTLTAQYNEQLKKVASDNGIKINSAE